MPWTEITRAHYVRAGLRYASDLSDAEWEIVAPLLPAPFAVGRPREVELREVVNAILFVATTGCQGRRQSKSYTARSRTRAGWSSTVFAYELPPRSAGFDPGNRLYLFALTVPIRFPRSTR